MTIKRRGSAVWQGGLKDGKGTVSTGSGTLTGLPYGFSSRFENQQGTNPEELLAAAHAGCFSMALSKILGDAGFTADTLETTAEVSLNQVEGGFAINAVHLTLKASVPGVDADKLNELADMAKAGCPVSKLFNADITLDVTLFD
jgi:lipoyl-dependent peroxiredoxin